MNPLDDFIKENQEMFMTTEPPDGHRLRFGERLMQEKRKNRIRFITRVSSIAAIGLIVIASTLFIYERYFDQPSALMSLSDVNAQLEKVEYYYTSQINDIAAGMDSLSPIADSEVRKLMTNELAEMDSIHVELQKKLGTHPGDERIINAMIAYYQRKLGMMNAFLNTLTQIKQTNNQKKDQHESTLL